MRLRRTWLVLVLLLVAPTAASAHTHVWDIFFGPSYANASNLSGFHIAFALAPAQDETSKNLSIVADTSVHFGTHEQKDLTRVMFSGGLRYTPHDATDRHLTSVQVLVGRVWDRNDFDDAGFGVTFGALYEYLLSGYDGRGWAFRGQGDFVVNQVDKFPRLSAGLAYHWK
jgi:hypothetical protein